VASTRFLDLEVRSRHVAFVLDASGSMARPGPDGTSRWERAVASLGEALADLEASETPSRVNVHAFQDEVASAFPAARRLTPAARRTLLRFVGDRVPAGRTALYDGIATALADPQVDTVVVLSDGAPSAGSFFTKTDLLGEVAARNRWRRARVDVVDVGGGRVGRRWHDVLRRLAEAHGGAYVRR
jgi:Mg-chelatase subunit ChlD